MKSTNQGPLKYDVLKELLDKNEMDRDDDNDIEVTGISEKKFINHGYTYDGRSIRIESWENVDFTGLAFIFIKLEKSSIKNTDLISMISHLEEYKEIPDSFKLDPQIKISNDINDNQVYAIFFITFIK